MIKTDSESTYRSVLKIKNFRLLALGTATSEIGDWLYNVALLVYVYEATQSPGWLGAATIGRLLPYVFLAPLGGLLADRFDRVRVMVLSNIARLVIFTVATVAVALQGAASVIIVLAMLGTAAGAAYRPASGALLPELVGESRLAPAMAFLSTLFSVALVAGPALGAVILAIGPPALAFGINAATFAVSSIFLVQISTRSAGAGEEPEKPASAWRMFADGLRAVRDTPYVPVITLLCFVGTLGYGAETVLIVVYAEERLGVGADGYGYVIAASGVGGVVAGLVGARIAGRPRVATTITVSGGLVCLGSVLYALTTSLWLALLIAFLTGVSLVVADVVSDVAITRASAGDVLGRIYGALDGLTVAGTVLGAVVAPLVISWLGIQGGLLLFGGITTIATLAAYPWLRRLDQSAARKMVERLARVRLLASVAVFTRAPAAALEQLAADSSIITVPLDTEVVVQGEVANAFYVVVDGDLSVWFVAEPEARPEFVRHLSGGDWFGEIGLLEGIPRTATVCSQTSCQLLRITSDTFLGALTERPTAYALLRQGVATRLGRTHPARKPSGSPADSWT